MFDDTKPIFLQLAERIADDILRGTYSEGEQAPSTNELAAYFRINPATAGKALNLLVDRRILVKRRGIGMFVETGARARIAGERTERFTHDFVRPLLAEAAALGLGRREVIHLIETVEVAAASPRQDDGLGMGPSHDPADPLGPAAAAAASPELVTEAAPAAGAARTSPEGNTP